ncbi:hypothetical protein Tco_0926246 [Tanacetum coccineum]|uniref:Uncharacterized protein n=1 Tax=Tanacetum coccineum TaxID=301880 RepID=A0ABQ5DAE9_9ASTR
MQELLLKLMNDLQILRGIQPKQAEQEEQAAKSFTPYGNFSMIDDVEMLQDRENLMKDIQTFLRKFSRIPFGEIPKDCPDFEDSRVLHSYIRASYP